MVDKKTSIDSLVEALLKNKEVMMHEFETKTDLLVNSQ